MADLIEEDNGCKAVTTSENPEWDTPAAIGWKVPCQDNVSLSLFDPRHIVTKYWQGQTMACTNSRRTFNLWGDHYCAQMPCGLRSGA